MTRSVYQQSTVAGFLRNPAPTQAEIRSAINRAYFAALGEAREFAIRHGYVPAGRGGSHRKVWEFLRNGLPALPPWQASAWKAVGDAGIGLSARRVDADYRSGVIPTVADARAALGLATRLVDRVLRLP